MGRFGAGQAVTRVEDQRFLTGTGRYTDDVTVEGMAHSAVVRSPHAHAEIKAIDTSAALVMPGVVAVLTAADLRADGVKSLPVVACVANADGSRMTPLPRPVLAAERVCHAGEGVALVIAETLLQAKEVFICGIRRV
ncbi:MAG: xanthine dehydrogenase family protein molybdopterin-binding subunit, partial [Rhodospirillaceae bacterium]